MRGDQSLFCPRFVFVVCAVRCVCYGPGQVYFSWIQKNRQDRLSGIGKIGHSGGIGKIGKAGSARLAKSMAGSARSA